MKTLSFNGSGYEYFKIWIVNILLTIVTLGLYYPWAKVRNLRYFYGNTVLENRNFDYHATGKQLFISYVIALILLIIYVMIQQVSPIGSLLVIGILFLAIPWIVWRSLMFSMRMTSFSNVRFSFDGKLSQAYINFLLLPLLLVVCFYGIPIVAAVVLPMFGGTMGAGTGLVVFIAVVIGLGLAVYLFGLIKKRNSMYIINGTQYGQGRFSTDLETKVFVKILLKTIGLAIALIIALFLIVALFVYMSVGLEKLQEIQLGMTDPSAMEEVFKSGIAVGIIAAIYLGFIFLTFLIAGYSYTRQHNYIVNNTVLDDKIALASTLKARSFALLMITNLLLVLVTLGLGLPWAKVRMARFIVENTQVDTEAGFEGYVTQQQEYQSSLGDQIGDAFDIDAGLAI